MRHACDMSRNHLMSKGKRTDEQIIYPLVQYESLENQGLREACR